PRRAVQGGDDDTRRLDRRSSGRRALRTQVGRGGGHPFDQVNDEDGRAALQESGDGPQGDLGSPAGVQPAAHGHGGGRQREQCGASRDQFQGGQADPECVRAEVGGGAAGAACGSGGGDDSGGGLPPGGKPSGTVGAASVEEEAQADEASGASQARRQTGAESVEVVLAPPEVGNDSGPK